MVIKRLKSHSGKCTKKNECNSVNHKLSLRINSLLRIQLELINNNKTQH